MGLIEAKTPSEVDTQLTQPDTPLVFVNSVCGCTAGGARPGLDAVLKSDAKRPQRCVTVFAGVNGEAAQRARSNFAEYPPSSPSAALLKNGEIV